MTVTTRPILAAHPGASPLIYELAASLPTLTPEGWFATGFMHDPAGPLAAAVRWLPAGLAARIVRELGRRAHPGVDIARTATRPFWELAFVAAARTFPARPHWARGIMHHRNRRFDRWTADLVGRLGVGAVIGHDTSTLATFRAAQRIGAVRVLNQVIGHLAVGARTLREEAARLPAFADSLHLDAPNWLVDQCLAEAREADLVLAPSPYVQATLVEVGVAPERVALVPYGVRLDRFHPPERPRDDGVFRVIYVGQISQRKGLKYLLDAMDKLAGPGVELVLVGGMVGQGEGFRPYAGRFRHVPNLPHAEVAALYRQADVMAYPSLHEGSALAILEGMASGLPVVTTPNAGSWVRDDVDGHVVPIRDVDALAERLARLRDDPGRRAEMGAAARARALVFSWEAYRVALAAAVTRALAGGASSA
jgi:glycosyltransferase involved in cell wall biosynthesis